MTEVRRLQRYLKTALLCGLAAWTLAAAAAVTDAPPQQREAWRTAMEALDRGDHATARAALETLGGHPLRPFVEARVLAMKLDDLEPEAVAAFTERHAAAVVSRDLRAALLRSLAERGDDRRLVELWDPGAADEWLGCRYAAALLATEGMSERADRQIERMWLHGRSRDDACDPVFAAWDDAGLITPERAWARFELAMEANEDRLAAFLSRRYLDGDDREWAGHWLRARERPAAALREPAFDARHPRGRRILRQAAIRYAGSADAGEAMTLWTAVHGRYDLPSADHDAVARAVGIRRTRSRDPRAGPWLATISADNADVDVYAWRVRAALNRDDWGYIEGMLAAAPPDIAANSRLRYWYARALERAGNEAGAHDLYAATAAERSYFGFLAAERAGLPYAFNHRATELDESRRALVASDPGLRMAAELFRLGERDTARAQWAWATRDRTADELEAAGWLASQLGWHDRAILALAQARAFDDVDLRFPLAWRDAIEPAAREAGIDPAWAWAVARQESALAPDARSPVGAVGLMQLMPETGRRMARELQIPWQAALVLPNPQLNARLGSRYVRHMLDRYQGNPVPAAAAYNAGPHRADRWLRDAGHMDTDAWIETIPFDETRGFLESVLAFSIVYDRQLGREPIPISRRMPPLPAAGS